MSLALIVLAVRLLQSLSTVLVSLAPSRNYVSKSKWLAVLFKVCLSNVSNACLCSETASHQDDEYAWTGVHDPKIMITTSHNPSSRLKQFAKVIDLHC